jgi:hypothetical protein
MAYFDYGYFSFSQKRIDKFDPKVERKKLVKKRTIINKLLANEMGKEFYDGKRINGYAGFKYDGRWKIFLKKIIKKYKLNNKSKVLDIGAKKGFFMHDLKKLLPGIKIYGVEDHYYPISKSMSSVKKKIKLKRFTDLNYKENYFDFVHAHNSIYQYNLRDIIKIMKIISKISKKSHITIPTYKNDEDRIKFYNWTLTGTLILSANDWKKLFAYVDYKGDYYFSGPKSLGI